MNETIIAKASELLSCDEGDNGIQKMVELIANNSQQDQLIDYIDGVYVWEKIEFEFTCKEFLEVIGFKN